MATDSYQLFYQDQVPDSATTLYTVAAGTSAIVRHMVAVNATGTDRTLTLWTNGSADENLILPPTVVPANDLIEWNGIMALGDGETLVGEAEAASAITLRVDGDEVTY